MIPEVMSDDRDPLAVMTSQVLASLASPRL
jgi:hypothetical protein